MALDAAAATACGTAIATTLAAGNPTALAAGIPLWTSIVTALFNSIKANGNVVPTLLVAPSGGGPVTGTGSIQ